jgi:hypothetical protein
MDRLQSSTDTRPDIATSLTDQAYAPEMARYVGGNEHDAADTTELEHAL